MIRRALIWLRLARLGIGKGVDILIWREQVEESKLDVGGRMLKSRDKLTMMHVNQKLGDRPKEWWGNTSLPPSCASSADISSSLSKRQESETHVSIISILIWISVSCSSVDFLRRHPNIAPTAGAICTSLLEYLPKYLL